MAGRRDRPLNRQRPIRAQRVMRQNPQPRRVMATGAETVFRAASETGADRVSCCSRPLCAGGDRSRCVSGGVGHGAWQGGEWSGGVGPGKPAGGPARVLQGWVGSGRTSAPPHWAARKPVGAARERAGHAGRGEPARRWAQVDSVGAGPTDLVVARSTPSSAAWASSRRWYWSHAARGWLNTK